MSSSPTDENDEPKGERASDERKIEGTHGRGTATVSPGFLAFIFSKAFFTTFLHSRTVLYAASHKNAREHRTGTSMVISGNQEAQAAVAGGS